MQPPLQSKYRLDRVDQRSKQSVNQVSLLSSHHEQSGVTVIPKQESKKTNKQTLDATDIYSQKCVQQQKYNDRLHERVFPLGKDHSNNFI